MGHQFILENPPIIMKLFIVVLAACLAMGSTTPVFRRRNNVRRTNVQSYNTRPTNYAAAQPTNYAAAQPSTYNAAVPSFYENLNPEVIEEAEVLLLKTIERNNEFI